MKIVLAGAFGNLGSEILKSLCRQGYEVVAADLRETDVPEDLYKEMKDLFERADFVKFAKYIATPEDNATVLPQAVRFVTATYQMQVEQEEIAGQAGNDENNQAGNDENNQAGNDENDADRHARPDADRHARPDAARHARPDRASHEREEDYMPK